MTYITRKAQQIKKSIRHQMAYLKLMPSMLTKVARMVDLTAIVLQTFDNIVEVHNE